MAYTAARRAREAGIRLALGARRGGVLRMFFRDALLLIAAGLAIGLPSAAAAARQIAAVLFGIAPVDPMTYMFTALVLAAAGLAAAFLPARRAAWLDPNRVLRKD